METSNTPRLVRALRRAYDQKKSRTELEGVEAGFTLIELMVVLLIMAILLAIAIPTFLGVKSGAQDRAAQSNLTNGLTSAKAAYANSGSYLTAAGAEASALNSAEPNISFTSGATANKGQNSVAVAVSTDGGQLLLVGSSASGTCWAAEDNESDNSTTFLANTPSSSGNGVEGIQYAHWTAPSTGCAASVPASQTWGTSY